MIYPKHWTWQCALLEHTQIHFMNEEFHVISNFSKFVQNIINEIEDYTVVFRYTGWNFDGKDCECQMNEKLPYPIYLRLINDENGLNMMSIADRRENSETTNKIYLTINSALLSNIGKRDIKSILYHECRHCLEMYVTTFNTINDIPFDMENEEIFDSIDNPNTPFICKKVLDLFSLSEQRARIDGAIHYLLTDNVETYGISDIERLVSEETIEHTLLGQMYYYIESIKEHVSFGMYELPLLIGYLYDKYRCGKTNFHITKRMISDIVDETQYELQRSKSHEVLTYLQTNYQGFLLRIKDAIFVHVIQNRHR